MHLPKISRADLLRCKLTQHYLDFDSAAAVFGFVREGTAPPGKSEFPGQDDDIFKTKPPPPPLPHELPPVEQQKIHFYRVTRRERLREESETSTGFPEWYEANTDTLADEARNSLISKHQPLKFKPLVPWARLWPFLHRTLGNLRRSRALDVDKIIRKLANGELIRRFPFKVHPAWSGSARLLIDINSHIFPLRLDLIFLFEKLKRFRGLYGLHVQYLDDQPGSHVYYWDKDRAITERWSPPDPDTPFLIISDLSMLSGSKRTLNNWLVFGRTLAMKGCRPTVLMPVPVRMIDARLLDYFDCVSWDKNSRLKTLFSINPNEISKEKHQSTVNQLLCRLAPAVRINPVLLREASLQVTKDHFDIGHEAAVWQHPSIQQHGDEFVWRPIDHEIYLQAFRKLPAQVQLSMIALIARYHSQLPEVLYFEAMLNCMQLAVAYVDPDIRKATERYMATLVRTSQEQPEYQGLRLWEGRFLNRQKAAILRKSNKIVGAIEGIRLQRNARVGQEIAFPMGINQSLVTPFLGQKNKNFLDLRQKGRELILVPQKNVTAQQEFSDSGSLLTYVRADRNLILRQSITQQGESATHILKFNPEEKITVALVGTHRYELELGVEKITVESLIKPEWAVSIGNDTNGLFAESGDRQGNIYCWYWHPPEWDAETGMLPGFWFYLPVSADTLKPDWAIAAGRDIYGFYADAGIANITQRFRWIEPTSFKMGSSEDGDGKRKKRYDDEVQHQVNLTQGYWLAETACPQKLWQAVMGQNPSEFKGASKPVETVSWDDVQEFLQRVNRDNPELRLRLPTEAEWENACRAGTKSVFHFGSDIALDQVNYCGTWDDYNNWGKGALQQTAAVKNFPPNAWGLYEMHGNVWEWCQDWYGDYPSGSVADPQGPESGDGRVLRGGSWFSGGRYCRSARRLRIDPSRRYSDTGFRLARGHELKPVRTVRAGQQPADRSTTECAKAQTGDGLRSGEKDKGLFDRVKDIWKR